MVCSHARTAAGPTARSIGGCNGSRAQERVLELTPDRLARLFLSLLLASHRTRRLIRHGDDGSLVRCMFVPSLPPSFVNLMRAFTSVFLFFILPYCTVNFAVLRLRFVSLFIFAWDRMLGAGKWTRGELIIKITVKVIIFLTCLVSSEIRAMLFWRGLLVQGSIDLRLNTNHLQTLISSNKSGTKQISSSANPITPSPRTGSFSS